MGRRVLALAGMVVLLTSCRPDEIDLSYRFDAGAMRTYTVTAVARAEWDIGTAGAGSYRTIMEVTESIEPVGAGAEVSVVMSPIEVIEEGLPSPGTEERIFSLRVGPNGEVLEVLEVDGVPASALDQEQLSLIGTYRPPLPLEPVGPGDRWRSDQQVELPSAYQRVVTIGELDGLGLEGDRKVAELTYEGRGPLSWATSLAQGNAELTGTTTSRGTATLDVDGGFLRAARSTMHGEFEVRATPTDGSAPRSGTLELELTIEVTPSSGR